MNPTDFILTKHAIERLHERHPEFAKVVNKAYKNDTTKATEALIRRKMSYEFFVKSVEVKSFLNDTRFMTSLYDRYGYEHRYHVFERDNMLFIGITDDRGRYIVTTLQKDMHRTNHIRAKTKKWTRTSP